MSQALVYLILLAGLVIGQIFRIPLRPGSDLALRASDLVVAVVDLAWIGATLWRLAKDKKWPIANLTLTDKLFLAFEVILLLTFLPSLSKFGHSDILTGFGYLLRFQGYLLLYWVARSWGRLINPTTFQRYFVWSAVIVAVIGFVQLSKFSDFRFMTVFGWDPHVGRLLSTFYDPNYVCIYLGLGLIAATAQALFGRVDHRKWFYILGAIILVAMYLTYSRSGVISTAVAMVILGFRKNWKAGIAIAVIFAAMLLSPGRLGSRFTSLIDTTKIQTTVNSNGTKSVNLTSGSADTGTDRIASWKRAFAVIKSSPIYGVGYNNFGPASAQVGVSQTSTVATAGAAQSSDSSLLDIWATTGLIGLIIFLWYAGNLLKESLFVRRDLLVADEQIAWRLGYGVGLLALGIDSFFINSLVYPQLLIYWLLFGGILVSFTSASAAN